MTKQITKTKSQAHFRSIEGRNLFDRSYLGLTMRKLIATFMTAVGAVALTASAITGVAIAVGSRWDWSISLFLLLAGGAFCEIGACLRRLHLSRGDDRINR
ncbi:hypothetical protein [Rhizobium ruizarguesonis]|uniref:hypothetical protein n=1 Tax=Rhizobium ruizarguesonis TaxID=2081791 RepID=UPI0013C0B442|nr:hypothetical protein [Rhizobium ruizarguesonis]NEJ02632.1 hypothetical protein [Rhizobium ruizarguesonis]NEJ39759.1 hypothetical protein [Rhizobium ruizarguesonis]